MNFFQVEFEDGKSHEIKAPDEKHGVAWGKQKMIRMNQPSAKIFRTSPAKPDFRKHLATLENESYSSENPVLTREPEYQYKEPVKKKKARKSSGEKQERTSKVTHKVTLKEVAESLQKDAGAIRRKLRSSKVDKPEGGWGWDSWEDPTIKQIQEWFKEA